MHCNEDIQGQVCLQMSSLPVKVTTIWTRICRLHRSCMKIYEMFKCVIIFATYLMPYYLPIGSCRTTLINPLRTYSLSWIRTIRWEPPLCTHPRHSTVWRMVSSLPHCMSIFLMSSCELTSNYLSNVPVNLAITASNNGPSPSVPSPCQNQWWLVFNRGFGNKFQGNFKQGNEIQNVVCCKLATILSRPRYLGTIYKIVLYYSFISCNFNHFPLV